MTKYRVITHGRARIVETVALYGRLFDNEWIRLGDGDVVVTDEGWIVERWTPERRAIDLEITYYLSGAS